jgi:hypothetical protein
MPATLRWLLIQTSTPVADQFVGDIGLDVGEADREVGLQFEDLADLRAGERADLGLLLARDAAAAP